MKNRILLAAVLVMSLLCTAFVYQSKAPQPQWEYKIEYFGTVTEKKLNELGAQGWELTSTTTSGSGSSQLTTFYFKRQR